MINPATPHSRVIAAQLGHDPRYANSMHDDQPALSFGFRGALVGGASVTSYMTHLFVEAWGEDWLRRGTLTQRSRRPVYEGDTVTATATPSRRDGDATIADVVLRGPDGEEVAYATGGLPDAAAPPPGLADHPYRPHLVPPPVIAAGGHAPGDLLYSTEANYTEVAHAAYLERVRETLPIFTRDKAMHPGFILAQCMHDGVASYSRPTPGIHVSLTGRNFAIAHVGDVISTSGCITGVFERKGSHYMEAEQLVIANRRTPIALFRRVSIYAMRAVA